MRRLERWRQGRSYIPESVRAGFRRMARRDEHAWWLRCAAASRRLARDGFGGLAPRRDEYAAVARDYLARAAAVRRADGRRLP